MSFSHFKTRVIRVLTTTLALVSLVVASTLAAPSAMAAPVSVQPALVQINLATAPVKTCTVSTSPSKRPTLRPGDTGSCVSLLQRILLNKGYNLGVKAPTGAYRTKTKAAVQQFQRDNKLKPDAVVGPITWGKLSGSATKPKPTKTKPVVLTFDDCPVSVKSANSTLLAAKNMGMHLRLYVTGNCLKAKKFDIATARKYGHVVCSHSNTHAQLNRLSKAGVRKEMNVKGLSTNCGRPPYGAVNATVRAVFAEKKMSLDLWDVDTNDWRGKTQAQVVSWTVKYSRPGDVVLMHFQHKGFSADALKQMKTGLAKRGLAVK